MTPEQERKKEWLNRAFYADQKIKALEAVQIEDTALVTKYKEKCTNLQELASFTEELEKRERELRRSLDGLQLIREEIRVAIKAVHNPEAESILNMKYLGYMKTCEIADKLNYDRRTIQRKHIEALDSITIDTMGEL